MGRLYKTKQALNNIRNYPLNDKGFGMMAIMPVLSIILILSILGFGLMYRTGNATHSASRETASMRAFYVAEAGINDYLWHLNKNNDYYITTVHPAQGLDGGGAKKWITLDSTDTAFHLEVAQTTDTPGVVVTATGRATSGDADAERTIQAIIKKKSFTRYIYFTNYETDELSGLSIVFTTGDTIRGALFSNDTIHINGNPTFEKKVTTAETISKTYSSQPTFQQGYEEQAPVLGMPQTNTSLINWSKSLAGGYYYYGMTTIILNSNGTMSITNTNPLSEAPTGTATAPVTLPIPASGVIYVNGTGTTKGGANTGDVYVKGQLKGRLTIAVKNNIYVFGDITYNTTGENPPTTMLGLVAENYVYVMRKWSGGGSQLPPNGSAGSTDIAQSNITINAAILAINHSFGFEDAAHSSTENALTVKGSIAQMYRGIVGYLGSPRIGYLKDYSYDDRMLYQEPPHFINPLGAGFGVVSWNEL
ncbi:MAG TPA: hypothetical protein VGK02_07175 [Candidatus Aquicultor sp.]|jgi:Tfp pilus assembly protein PilX